jgi:hypothetical protein
LPPGIEPVSPERLHGRALHLFLKSLAGRLRDRESVLYRLHRFRLIHRCCQSLCRSLRCEHTLQSVSDRRRHQTNIHSSARSAAPRIRARLPNQPSKPLMMCFIIAAQDEATLSRRNPQCPLSSRSVEITLAKRTCWSMVRFLFGLPQYTKDLFQLRAHRQIQRLACG